MPVPVEDVWEILSEPARLVDWWPGLAMAEPTVRRALAPGALWRVEGDTGRLRFRKQPELSGTLLILEVVPLRRVVFQLAAERIDVELDLEPTGDGETVVTLIVDAPRLSGIRRPFPSQVLARLRSVAHEASA